MANQIDREDRLPAGLGAKAAELNFYGLFVPEEYGGLGQNLTSACSGPRGEVLPKPVPPMRRC